ncbi:NADPH-dependent FMN reductase [Ferriphaselus sp. R-1]|uniref:NADPH-dependent FMN reductase n=1 Tax=Ferriphaselus sp. R-1 TaxID=1485544 RepID=UPI000550A90B|nr:NADPH-dependent FMN reductase [Ferriphaselus sp. R-1]
MTILLIGGSPSTTSRTGRLLQHIGVLLEHEGFDIETLHVRDLPADALLHADYKHPEIVRATARVARADAIVFATPVYKAAYSGILKAFIDVLPQFGLKGKVVLPIASGGSLAHTLILDYALRPVLASLYPQQILDSIYAVEEQIVWSEASGLTLDPAIEQRVGDGIAGLQRALRGSKNIEREAVAA